MDITNSIFSIPVQDPKPKGEVFSSIDLHWTKFGSADRYDDVAVIPYERVEAFIDGESFNYEFPTQFHIERGRKRVNGSLQDKEYKNDEYLEYRM